MLIPQDFAEETANPAEHLGLIEKVKGRGGGRGTSEMVQ